MTNAVSQPPCPDLMSHVGSRKKFKEKSGLKSSDSKGGVIDDSVFFVSISISCGFRICPKEICFCYDWKEFRALKTYDYQTKP